MNKNHTSNHKYHMLKSDRRISMKYVYLSAFTGVAGTSCIAQGTMSLAAIKLGAGDVFLGLLAFASLAPLIVGLLTVPVIEYRGKKHVMVFWGTITALLGIAHILTPTLVNYWPAQLCLLWMFTAVLLQSTANALAWSGWFPLLHDIVPPRLMGRFFGNLRAAWSVIALFSMLAIALFLGKNAQWWKFQTLFTISVAILLLKVLFLSKLKENPPVKTKQNRSSLRLIIKEFIHYKPCRPLVAYLISYAVPLMMAETFKIKLLKDLGYSEGFILAAQSMVNLGMILSVRYWGKLADRFGNRSLFSITHIAMITISFSWVFVQHASAMCSIFVFLLYFLFNVFNSGNGIAQTRYIMHAIPSEKQTYITILNNAVFITWGIAPVIGGILLKLTSNLNFNITSLHIGNYQLLFILTGCLFIIPHRLRLRLGLNSDTPTLHVINFVIRPIITKAAPFIRYTRP